MQNQWLTAEFHCHTIYSPDSLTYLEQLIKQAEKAGIERVAITDHNTARGALLAHKLAPERIIVGEEIRTTKGEILALFIQEEVRRGLSPQETISILKSQDAFIIIPHPFDLSRHGWKPEDLAEILPDIDAIEVFNAHNFPIFNRQAKMFAEQNQIAQTVGSDAHSMSEIGQAMMRLPYFTNAQQLRQVIRQGTVHLKPVPLWRRFTTTGIKLYKKIRRVKPPV